MKRALLILVVSTSCAHATESARIFDGVRPSVVTVSTRDELNQIDSEGSGVVIASNLVITNCHVVNEANTIQIRSGDKTLPATLALSDTERDLCQLNVPDLAAPPVKIRSYHELAAGEEIYAVGNPLGLGLSVSTGIVSAIGEYKGKTQIFSSAPVSPGSSGGGLFDAQGRLVGIVTGYFSQAQNFNLALPADWIADIPGRAKPMPQSDLGHDADPDWFSEAEKLRLSKQWAKIIELARQWLAVYPTSALANYYQGIALYNQNDDHEAENALMRSISADPLFSDGYAYLAVVRQRLGNIEAAQNDVQRAIQLNPSQGNFWRIQADIQHQAGLFNDAISSMQTAVKLTPQDVDSWQYLGSLLHEQKNLVEAIKAYQIALRLRPDYPLVATNLAAAQASLGQVTAAKQSLISSNGDKSDSATWTRLGVEEEKQKNYSEAERMYRKALELDPGSAGTWHLLGLDLMRSNRNSEAEKALRQAIKYKPDDEPSWGVLGQLLLARDDQTGALEAFEQSVLLNPVDPAAWYFLGTVRKGRKDLVGAITAYTKATQLDPDRVAGWRELGTSQIDLGQWDDALKSLQIAEKLDPQDGLVNQALSKYYGMRGDPQQSLVYSDRALDSDRADPYTWSNKGYALLKLERYPEAVQSLETAIKLNPDFSNAWTNLGETYLRQKQLGKAITTLEHAIKLAPDSPDTRLYLAQAYRRSGQVEKSKEHLDVLLQKHPNYVPALFMMLTIHLSQGNQPEGLAVYSKLKALAPALARDLRDKSRAPKNSSGFVLPE